MLLISQRIIKRKINQIIVEIVKLICKINFIKKFQKSKMKEESLFLIKFYYIKISLSIYYIYINQM